MEGVVIKEGANLISTLVNHEGKEQVISTGKCPVCDKEIVFTQDIIRRDRYEELAGSLYQLFLTNNEVCFSCNCVLCNWVKAHKGLCDRKHITYREVGNKYLEKQGKKPIIGLTLVSNDEEEEAKVEETSVVSQPIQGKIEVNNE